MRAHFRQTCYSYCIMIHFCFRHSCSSSLLDLQLKHFFMLENPKDHLATPFKSSFTVWGHFHFTVLNANSCGISISSKQMLMRMLQYKLRNHSCSVVFLVNFKKKSHCDLPFLLVTSNMLWFFQLSLKFTEKQDFI